MRGIQKWIVLVGIGLNLLAFVYSIYARILLYSIVFGIVTAYLVIVYATNDSQPL